MELKRQRPRRKINRKVFYYRTLLVFARLITIGSLIMYLEYRHDQHWVQSQVTGKENQIPPEFANNDYDMNLANDINQLTPLSKVIKQIEKDGELTNANQKQAQSALKKADPIIKKYKINGGKTLEQTKTIQMFLDANDLLDNYYQSPDPQKLSRTISAITAYQTTQDSHNYDKLLNKLNDLSSSNEKLTNFLTTWVDKIGKVEHGVMSVNPSFTSSDNEKMLTQINDDKLSKFTIIKDLKKQLQSKTWSAIMDNNDTIQQEQAWNNILQEYQKFNQDQYWSVSDWHQLSDIAQIPESQKTVKGLTPKDGMTISSSSPITKVQVDGKTIEKNQYIKKDQKVTFTISPVYQ